MSQSVQSQVLSILKDRTGHPYELGDPLGLYVNDSIDLMHLLYDVEDEFSIKLVERNQLTVGELIEQVERALEALS